MNSETLISIALEAKATAAAVIETSKIEFFEEVRQACEKNYCRKYDTNWMGPPAIGSVSELKKRAIAFSHGLLFQSAHEVKSNFDLKGMFEKAKVHESIFRELLKGIKAKYPDERLLPLNAGCCSICEKCAYLDSKPCRHPDLAVSSVEAYGINVIALQKAAGLQYYYGKNWVCYVGLLLFNQ